MTDNLRIHPTFGCKVCNNHDCNVNRKHPNISILNNFKQIMMARKNSICDHFQNEIISIIS